LLLYTALGAGLFFLPLNLQQVQGYSATAAGAAFLPFILLVAVLSQWAGGLTARIGARIPLTTGSTLAAIGFALFALPGIGGSYWLTFFPAVVVLGLGFAIAVAPLTTTVMTAVADHYAGTASGINNAVSRLASLLAVSIFGLVMVNVFSSALDVQLSQTALEPTDQAAILEQRTKLAAIQPPSSMNASQQTSIRQAVQSAFVHGYRIVALAMAVLALGAALVAGLAIEDAPVKSQAQNNPPE
jgi:MFS family permease